MLTRDQDVSGYWRKRAKKYIRKIDVTLDVQCAAELFGEKECPNGVRTHSTNVKGCEAEAINTHGWKIVTRSIWRVGDHRVGLCPKHNHLQSHRYFQKFYAIYTEGGFKAKVEVMSTMVQGSLIRYSLRIVETVKKCDGFNFGTGDLMECSRTNGVEPMWCLRRLNNFAQHKKGC